MEKIKNSLRGRLTAIAACLALTLGLGSLAATTVAHAQDPGFTEQVAGGVISIAAGTPAVLVTGTTTQQIVIRSIQCATISAGGQVTFYNGSSAPASTSLKFANGNGFSLYCPVSTSVNNNVLASVQNGLLPALGSGVLATSVGNSFCAQLNGATLCYQIKYVLQ